MLQYLPSATFQDPDHDQERNRKFRPHLCTHRFESLHIFFPGRYIQIVIARFVHSSSVLRGGTIFADSVKAEIVKAEIHLREREREMREDFD